MSNLFHNQEQILKSIPKGIFLGSKEIPTGGWRTNTSSLSICNEFHHNPSEFHELEINSLNHSFKKIPNGIFLGSKEIPTGGWRAYSDVYRNEEGDHIYEFEFHEVDDHYEIDIISTPSYEGRATDGHSRHVLHSDRGGERICFADDSAVRSLSDARKYAESWAESTSDYIKYGDRF